MTPSGAALRAAAALLPLALLACGEGPVEPRTLASLAPGEITVLTGPEEVRSVRLPGTDEARTYLLTVQNVDRAPGSLTLSLFVRAAGAPSASAVATPFPASSREASGAAASAVEPGRNERAATARLRLEGRMREALRRAGARPAAAEPRFDRLAPRTGGGGRGAEADRAGGRDPGTPRGLFSLAARAGAEVGDTLGFRMAVSPDLSVDCQDTSRVVRAVVRAVGDRFLLAEDARIEIGFSPFDWSDLERLFDDVIFPVDSAYFGAPADIDGNGRIVALVTPEVNRLAPRGSGTFVGGFFWPGDLSERSSCPASNRGEILYLLAPDLTGRFADPKSPPAAKRNAMEVAAHELQHLISAQQRVTLGSGGFESLEEAWLGEGMAHLAEEVVGLRAAGGRLRANLSPETIAVGSRGPFGTFIRSDFVRLAWHLREPHRTAALAADDPADLGSLAMRGNAWLFLRWLADRFAAEGEAGALPGADETGLFRELSSGGPARLTGIANVERALEVTGSPVGWEALVGEFAPVPALDDAEPGVEGEALATWDLRAVFRRLHEADGEPPFDAAYPLQPTTVRVTPSLAARFDASATAFGVRYYLLEAAGPAPELVLELTGPDGRSLPGAAAPQLSLVRLR